MVFKRTVYTKLLDWKEKYANKYAALIEGARRVGKSTIVEEFAKKEYKSYIFIDFAVAGKEIKDCFNDIGNIDMFFLRLQAATGVTLVKKNSIIIFDEVQLFPAARQAIKYLVRDGRYHYIETGSLISIKRNVKDILIPSEEMKIEMFPMDYEEFTNAVNPGSWDIMRAIYETGKPVGQEINRHLMRNFRLYMAVGGMPQAVEAYLSKEDFTSIDRVKREIIALYEDDFHKIDSSGRISLMYHSIPAQLSRDARRYYITKAVGRKRKSDEEKFFDLLESKTVNIAYNTGDPRVSLSLTRSTDSYKLYVGDTGLFVSLMFIDRAASGNDLYTKLLSDHLPANLGYLYENAVAQIIASEDRELYYHTWAKRGSTHEYEVDFLLSIGAKVTPIEVKSSGMGKHESISEFIRKYSGSTTDGIILSQKDRTFVENRIKNLPIYLLPFVLRKSK